MSKLSHSLTKCKKKTTLVVSRFRPRRMLYLAKQRYPCEPILLKLHNFHPNDNVTTILDNKIITQRQGSIRMAL